MSSYERSRSHTMTNGERITALAAWRARDDDPRLITERFEGTLRLVGALVGIDGWRTTVDGPPTDGDATALPDLVVRAVARDDSGHEFSALGYGNRLTASGSLGRASLSVTAGAQHDGEAPGSWSERVGARQVRSASRMIRA